MKLLKNNSNSAEVQLSIDDLITIHQSLNEVCNGIHLFEFQTRIGVSKEEVSHLMTTISQIINKIDEKTAEES